MHTRGSEQWNRGTETEVETEIEAAAERARARAREREGQRQRQRERETALVGMFIYSCCLVCNCNADNAITIAVTLGVPLVQARSLIRCTSRTPSTHTDVAVAGRRTCWRRQGILGHLSQGLR